jgi:hypothetical protein
MYDFTQVTNNSSLSNQFATTVKEEEVLHMYDRWEALNGGSGLRKEDLALLLRELLPHFSVAAISETEPTESATPFPPVSAPVSSIPPQQPQAHIQLQPQLQPQPQPQYNPYYAAPSAPPMQPNATYAYAPNAYRQSSYPPQLNPYVYNPVGSTQYPAPYTYSFDGRTVTINSSQVTAPGGNGYYLFYPPRQNVAPQQNYGQYASPVMTGIPAIPSAPVHHNTLAPPTQRTATSSTSSSSGTSSPTRSPSPSRRGTESPLSTSANVPVSSALDDEIIELIFKHYAKGSIGAHLIAFDTFAEIIAMSYRGSLADQFSFAFKIVKNTNTATKEEFFHILRVMYRLGYDGDTPLSRNTTKLKGFVGVIWDQLHHLGPGPIDYDTLHNLVITKGLLEDFWTQLYVM